MAVTDWRTGAVATVTVLDCNEQLRTECNLNTASLLSLDSFETEMVCKVDHNALSRRAVAATAHVTEDIGSI